MVINRRFAVCLVTPSSRQIATSAVVAVAATAESRDSDASATACQTLLHSARAAAAAAQCFLFLLNKNIGREAARANVFSAVML